MADFDVNTITVQGAVAIASATAGDKLVIDGCDATTDVLTQAQAVQIATRPVSPASTTDTIGLAGSTDNHVYAYASFIRGESTGGDVHSFLLYGHMESDATNVFVVAVASATAPTHIPTSSDVTNRVEIQFELTFSATDEVVTVTDTSMYTTRGEFLILKNRTVTTHAEGQATVGEDQTVYGKKEFMDDMIFNGMYQVQAKTLEGQNTQNMFAFTQNGERQNVGPTITALTTYNGTSYVSSNASIGATATLALAGGASFSAEHKAVGDSNATMEATRGLGGAYAGVVVEPTHVTLYTQAASGGERKTLSYTGVQLTGSFNTIGTDKDELNIYAESSLADIDMHFDATVSDATWSVNLMNHNNDKTARLKFYAGADSGGQLTCVSATGGTSKLGTSATPWSSVYARSLHSSELKNDSTELSLYTYGSIEGYSNSHSEIRLSCDDPEDPFAVILLKSSTESVAEYSFDTAAFYAVGKNLGSANGGGWNNIYANSSIHTPLIIGDQRELVLDAQGTGNGKTEIGMYCTDSSVSVSINLQANQESNVVYAFTRYSLSGPGKDLGYRNGGEWNNIYANKLHGCIPYPSESSTPATNIPPVGSIFLAFIETLTTGPEVTYGNVIDAATMTSYYAIARMGVAFFKIPSSTTVPGTEWSTYQSITTGKYVALSAGATTNMNKTLCLMMRIE